MSSKTKKQISVRKEEKRTNSPADTKRILTGVIISAVAIAVIVWAILSYGTAVSLIKPSKGAILSSPEDIGIEDVEAIEILTRAGERLSGWYMPASGDAEMLGKKVIIISHNYESNREMTEISGMYFYKYLLEAGYDVVTFDYSGSGISTGSYYTFGCQEKDELLSVIDYVHEMNPDADMALCGWAFGASAAIEAGCESEYVTAIIADSAYADLDGYLKGALRSWTGLPSFLFDASVKFLMERISGCDFSEASPVKSIKNTSDKSFYFIHSTEDDIIPVSSSESLFSAADENNYAEIWTPTGEHILGFETQEENYKNRVINFLNEHF